MNYDNLSNATCTLLSMDKWADLESCSMKIFNENLFIKSGDMVSFDLELVACNCDLDYK